MLPSTELQAFLDTSLERLRVLYALTNKTVKRCDRHHLHNLGAILAYFKTHKTFMNLAGVGFKIDRDLSTLCRDALKNPLFDTTSKQRAQVISRRLKPNLLNLPLEKLAQRYEFSVRAFNICNKYGLHTLELLLTHFKQHGNFQMMNNIGVKTNQELSFFCINMLETEDLKDFFPQHKEVIVDVLADLSPLKTVLADRITERLMKTLSARAITGLTGHFKPPITFEKLHTTFYDRSDIIKIYGIGTATVRELIDFMDALDKEALQIEGFKEEEIPVEQLIESLMNAYNLPLSDMAVFKTALESGHLPMFSFIDMLLHKYLRLNDRSMTILRLHPSYFMANDSRPLEDLAPQFKVTLERIRQIYSGRFNWFKEIFVALKDVKTTLLPYFNYPIADWSSDFIAFTNVVSAEINRRENCSFSLLLIVKILNYLQNDRYIVLTYTPTSFDVIYLVEKSLAEQFDFKAFFKHIHLVEQRHSKRNFVLDFNDVSRDFLKKKADSAQIVRIQEICTAILLTEYTEGLKKDEQGNLVFIKETGVKPLTTLQIFEHIIAEKGVPVSLQTIQQLYLKDYGRNISLASLSNLFSKNKTLFISFRSNKTYGLKKWETDAPDEIKSESMKFILNDYLRQFDVSKHISDIFKHVRQYRPTVTKASVARCLSLDSDMFVSMNNSFWGTTAQQYAPFESHPIPFWFFKSIVEFMTTHQTNESETIEALAKIHQLQAVQIRAYIQYSIERGKLKREKDGLMIV